MKEVTQLYLFSEVCDTFLRVNTIKNSHMRVRYIFNGENAVMMTKVSSASKSGEGREGLRNFEIGGGEHIMIRVELSI